MSFNYGIVPAGAILLISGALYPRKLLSPILIGGCAGLGLIVSIHTVVRVAVVVVAIFVLISANRGDGAAGVPSVVFALTSAIVQEAGTDLKAAQIAIEAAVVVSAVCWAMSTHAVSYQRTIAGAEFCFWSVVLGMPDKIGPQSRHMTWWGISILAAYLFCVAVGARQLLQTTQSVVAGAVIIGTWAMSFAKCDVLETAFDHVGPLVYVLGNFALHYYPISRACSIERGPVDANGALLGIALVATYIVTLDAIDVYGCESIPAAVPILGIPASAAATMFAMLG